MMKHWWKRIRSSRSGDGRANIGSRDIASTFHDEVRRRAQETETQHRLDVLQRFQQIYQDAKQLCEQDQQLCQDIIGVLSQDRLMNKLLPSLKDCEKYLESDLTHLKTANEIVDTNKDNMMIRRLEDMSLDLALRRNNLLARKMLLQEMAKTKKQINRVDDCINCYEIQTVLKNIRLSEDNTNIYQSRNQMIGQFEEAMHALGDNKVNALDLWNMSDSLKNMTNKSSRLCNEFQGLINS